MKVDDSGQETQLETADDGRGAHNAKENVPDETVDETANTADKNEFEDEELGIYEDTDDGDDLTDTELELERLRLEKRVREENERLEREKEQAREAESKSVSEVKPEEKKVENLQTPRDTGKDQSGIASVTPRTDHGVQSKASVQSWLTPRQGAEQPEKPARVTQRAKTTNMALELAESRNASRLALESREAMFRRAMTLLSARCTSTKHDIAGERLPFGYQIPKYFYVTQEKPVPMEPLKAWRGYNGNIYFEPISIQPVHDAENDGRAKTSIPRQPKPPTRALATASKSAYDKENRPFGESRSESRQTSKSSQGSQLMSSRQMAILDKQMVLTRFNESLQEDLTWLEGQENTGSLAIRPKTYPSKTKKEIERDMQYNKERIKKGSVAHKLYIEKKSKQKPKLSVSGGKFTPPTSMSPLLRTQTQYSLSSHRLTTNSPDPYHLNDSKLPPLDHIRATIKHMDNKSESSFPGGKPYNRSVTITDEMKPFVKYSPDVVAKMSQQANVC